MWLEYPNLLWAVILWKGTDWSEENIFSDGRELKQKNVISLNCMDKNITSS